MARTDNLTNFLTDIADAIRTKTGSTNPIQASSFDTAIESIPSGGEHQPTGHADAVGLAAIGWTADDIAAFQANGVFWDAEDDAAYALTDYEKAGGLAKADIRYAPGGTTYSSFSSYSRMFGFPISCTNATSSFKFSSSPSVVIMPQINTTNLTSSGAFRNIRKLKKVPDLTFPNLQDAYQLFEGCCSLSSVGNLSFPKVYRTWEMFSGCSRIKDLSTITFGTGKITDSNNMFNNCYMLEKVPTMDLSSSTTFYMMFNGCYSLNNIPEIDASSVTNVNGVLSGCSSLVNFGGFKDLGKAYSTSASAGSTNYALNLVTCPNLSHDSLMNIINKLYDIATAGCAAQNLSLGTINASRLTAEEIAIATNKGWNVITT